MGRVVSIALLCVVLSADSSMAGQAKPDGEFPITSWQALPFWSPAGSTAKVPVDGGSSPAMTADLTTPMPFVAVTLCRIVDTRRQAAAIGLPGLEGPCRPRMRR